MLTYIIFASILVVIITIIGSLGHHHGWDVREWPKAIQHSIRRKFLRTQPKMSENVDWFSPKKRLAYETPKAPIHKGTPSLPTIFVSIASYRDSECPQTVVDLFDKADHPERIFIGLVQQNDTSDIDCASCHINKGKITSAQCKYASHITNVEIPYNEAQGPTWARYIASHLWQGQDYVLQLDSHMRLRPHWDTDLLHMHQLCPYPPRAILTHYPPSYHLHKTPEFKDNSIPLTCGSKFNSSNLLTVIGHSQPNNKDGKIKEVPFIAGGFIFGKSDFLQTTPMDPYLPFVFVGEEVLHSVRLWTDGWTFYTPLKNVCLHLYGRKNDSRFWDDMKETWQPIQKLALERLHYILEGKEPSDEKVLIDIDRYGLGHIRSLAEYEERFGIDFKEKKVTKDWCKVCKGD